MPVTGPTFGIVTGEGSYDGRTATWVISGAGPQNGNPVGSPSPGAGSSGVGFFAGYADKTFQVTGTFGVGATLSIQGSNDGTNWSPLTTPSGIPGALGTPAAASFTTASGGGIEQVLEACQFYRPSLTGGDGTTNLTIVLFARKTQQP